MTQFETNKQMKNESILDVLHFALMNSKIVKRLKSKGRENKQNLEMIRKNKALSLYLSAKEVDLGRCGLYMQWRIASQIAQTKVHFNRGKDGVEARAVELKYVESFRLNNAVLFVSDWGHWQREGLVFNVERLFSIKRRDIWNLTSSDYEKEFEKLWRY